MKLLCCEGVVRDDIEKGLRAEMVNPWRGGLNRLAQMGNGRDE